MVFIKLIFSFRCSTTSDFDQDGKWGYCAESKCFKLVEDQMTYAEARNYCIADQASLASITNEYEQGENWKIIFYQTLLKIFAISAFLTASLRNKTYNSYYLGGTIIYYNSNLFFNN